MTIRQEKIQKLEAELILHRQTEEAFRLKQEHPCTPIEVSFDGAKWFPADKALCNWDHEFYRVSQSKKYRPWSISEAVGQIVYRHDHPNILSLITQASEKGVRIDVWEWISYEHLLEAFRQMHGLRCGVLE